MKFYSQAIPEHSEVPKADSGKLESLIEHWSEIEEESRLGPDSDGVYVASVGCEKDQIVRQAQLDEILSLTKAQGSQIVGQEILFLKTINPRTLIGKGKARDLAARARDCGASMIVLDAELSPSQMRNLEDEAGLRICDREAVILNVFLRNAKTKQAKMQVEIARLEYLRPRIRGVGIDMDQQMGGVKGSRGPGETASELMARQLDKRLAQLRKSHLRLSAADKNRRRVRGDCQRIALVGYTNAGKTSLMNALTSEDFSSADQPFETLDAVSRCLSRHGGRVLISDTVGFIRNLPDRLLESFESTLAELTSANLLAIVVDISDYEWETHLDTTLQMIRKLGAEQTKRVFVINKCDKLASVSHEEIQRVIGSSPYLLASAQQPESVSRLKAFLLNAARAGQREEVLIVPYERSDVLSLVYKVCRVLDSRHLDSGLELRLTASEASFGRVEKLLKGVRV